MENAIPVDENVVERIAQASRARRHPGYDDEVRRLLNAALTVMIRRGAASRPRVADIVAEAGLSNQAFYRHFPSREALVAALVDDGVLRLRDYLNHQMAKEGDPAARVRRWVVGVMAQAETGIASTTLVVLANAGPVADDPEAARRRSGGAAPAARDHLGGADGRHRAGRPLSQLLHEPFAALGGRDPELAASWVTHAALGRLSDHLTAGTQPSQEETGQLVHFALLTASSVPQGPRS